MKRLRIMTLCTVVIAACIFFFKKREPATVAAGKGLVIKKEWLAVNQHPLTPVKDVRPADQTFLTFPEWYLVFSPEEQANYFRQYTASSFPFMSHTAQIWESYHIVNDQIKDNFPVNKGYHFMIWVIGSSASVEYSVKAWYETVTGRITDTHEAITEEDRFNAKFTQEYVDFIKNSPWYAFDFGSQLRKLWSTSFFGDHFLRKIERKYILTSELLVKAGYGKLIGMGTKTVYEDALLTTAVVVDSKCASLKGAKTFGDSAVLVYLPRYNSFNRAADILAESGCNFKEVAGNNSAILLTVLVPSVDTATFEGTQIVFTQVIASKPSQKRVALAVPVTGLSKLLKQLDAGKISVEHIFDF
ncbi:hypothetical protein GO495_04440 [Chitinophaga oryziterrae]|uniref:Uncharacterized protein n=1 Tax=Chitinophaga oryziterrae TaxID=1031224 RepID=A0A6N8J3S6_9BACT|nr:hypothetical protein [Chitinophaga oryziterrae]MVT39820.1 hypothetical protein [Chitinophaga oryziterrae]